MSLAVGAWMLLALGVWQIAGLEPDNDPLVGVVAIACAVAIFRLT